MSILILLLALESSVRIAVIGDRTTSGDAPGAFATCIDDAVALSPDISIFVGDLVEGGPGFDADSEWVSVTGLIEPLAAISTIFMTPGNHDIRDEESAAAWSAASGAEPSRVEKHHGVVLVSWDSSRESVPGPGSLAVLESLLAGVKREDPCVLVTHRPFWLSDDLPPETLARIAELLEAADVEAVTAGHIHVFDTRRRNGILYVSAGPSGGAGLPAGPSGGAAAQVGLLLVDGDSVLYEARSGGTVLREGTDTGLERRLLELGRAIIGRTRAGGASGP